MWCFIACIRMHACVGLLQKKPQASSRRVNKIVAHIAGNMLE